MTDVREEYKTTYKRNKENIIKGENVVLPIEQSFLFVERSVEKNCKKLPESFSE